MVDLRLARAELPSDGGLSEGPEGPKPHSAAEPSRLAKSIQEIRSGATPASRGTSAASKQRSALTAKSAVVRSAGTGQARSPLPVSVSGTRADRGQTPRSGSAAGPTPK